LRRGAQALKAENAELRAETDRVRSQRRSGPRANGRDDGGDRIDVRLALDVQAPAAARSVVADSLGDLVVASVLDTAQLLVSELVTNSVRHSGAPAGAGVIVRVELTTDMVGLHVEDPGRGGAIAPHPPDSETGGGFGLNLVQTLSERWGVERVAQGGTRVWAQLPRAPLTAPASVRHDAIRTEHMSRLRCEHCSLVYQRAALARQMALATGVACPRCSGALRSEHAEADPDARDTTVAVRFAVTATERPPYA
jgi:serine/threonine-protein kinase RsbW